MMVKLVLITIHIIKTYEQVRSHKTKVGSYNT
jgi:hypothetical protein